MIKVKIEPPYRIDCSKLGFVCCVDGREVWTLHAARPRLHESGGRWEETVEGPKEVEPGKKRIFEQKPFRFNKVLTSESQLYTKPFS